MINEQTNDAVIAEREWLMRGQPTYATVKDEYRRDVVIATPTAAPMTLRAAHELACERAKTWAFECPNVAQQPIA